MVEARRTIAIHNAHPDLRFARRSLKTAIALLDAHAAQFLGGCPTGELSIVFLTDPALAKLHADFMNDPTATDVITFAGDATLGTAGEICVSADTAARFVGLPLVGQPGAARRRASAQKTNFSSELALYVVHGWLHLAGYDDLQPAKKRRMRAAEQRALTLLRAAKAMPAFKWA
jgi:probable rRNA maturation factor